MADITLPQVGTGLSLFGDDSAPAKVQGQAKQVQTDATNYGSMLDSVASEMTKVNQQKEDNLTRTAAAHETVNAALQTDTQDMMDRARPVFARQAALDARRQEVAEMNPIKRTIMGFVNRNYNPDHLDQLHDVNSRQISDIGQQYQETSALSDRLYEIATQHGADQEAILNAHGETLNSNLAMSANRLQASRAAFGDTLNSLSADREARQAQALAQEQALSGLTLGNIGALKAQAQKSGFATVGGAQVSLGQLTERSTQLQSQALELESHQLAVQSGKIALANASEERMITHMSPGDLTAAANAGGKWHGMQLSQPAIAQALAANASRIDTLSNMAGVSGQSSLTMGIMDNFVSTAHGMQARAANVFGNRVPPAMQAFIAGKTQEIQNLTSQMNSAKDPQVKQKILSDWAPKMAGWNQEMDGMIQKMTGGMSRDPAVQTLMHGWLTGSPVAPADAAKGVIGLIRTQGGMVRGVNLKGADGAAFSAAQQTYAQATQLADANKLKGPQREQFILEKVSGAMSNAYSNAKGNEIQNAIPGFAKSIGHPFGRVTAEDWAAARSAGTTNAYNKIGETLGLSGRDAQQLFGGGPQQAQLFSRVTGKGGKAEGQSMSQLQSTLLQNQMAETLTALDHGHAAVPGFVPSRALGDLLSSSKFQDAANRHLDNVSSGSFGGFMADGVSGGAVRGQLYNYAQNMIAQSAANEAARNAQYVQTMRGYNGDPVRRAGAILGSIPGIDQHSEAVLMSHIDQIARSTPQGMTPADAITNFINGNGGKFQNPQLEKMRRIAAQHWDDASTRTDKAMDRAANVRAIAQHYADNPLLIN